jgi:hypothetical protein
MDCGGRGIFRYPLITTVGKMLYKITSFSCSMNETTIRILKVHNDTMRVVFSDKTSGDGVDVSHQLINFLTRVIELNV